MVSGSEIWSGRELVLGLVFVFGFSSQTTLLPWQFPHHLVLPLPTLTSAPLKMEAPRDLPAF